MNENDISSISDTVELFYSESRKLENDVNQSLKNYDILSISEIIDLYYQVINVKSLVKFLKQILEEVKNIEENKLLLKKIKETEEYIGGKFDSSLHPLIMSTIKQSIEISMKKLKEITTNQNNKTQEDVENQAKMYEELRKIMSTKEFVEQYNIEVKDTR